MMKYAFLLAFFLIQSTSFAEDTLPAPVDSVKPHSVKKATILSAFVPGAGQIYNHLAMPKGKKKAFWKVPLIYAGLGGMTYFLATNHTEVLRLRAEYRYREEFGVPSDTKYLNYDDSGILTLHDQYALSRDFAIIGLAGVYAIQVLDAAIEAHFVTFDVSEDLSMQIKPTILSYNTPGVKLSLKFR